MSEPALVPAVICLTIPDGIDPLLYLEHPDPLVKKAFVAKLADSAYDSLWTQWTHTRPVRVEIVSAEWTITQDLADVAEFEPIHDCPRCKQGNTEAEEFLSANPGRWIAMGNLTYRTAWPGT